MLRFSARDWIRTIAGRQLFIDNACQNCVVKKKELECVSVLFTSFQFLPIRTNIKRFIENLSTTYLIQCI